MNKKIRILVADDHPIVREGLVHALKRQDDMCVIGEAADGEETCQLYDKLLPDILLLELKAEHALVLHNFERASTEVVKTRFPGK